MTHTRTILAIRREWPAIARRAEARGVRPGAQLPEGAPLYGVPPLRLLSTNHKLEKGTARALSVGLHLPPASEAYTTDKRTNCPWSTAECRAACLVGAGFLATDRSAAARLWRETLRVGHRDLFDALLAYELDAHEAAAEHQGLTPAVRLDVLSDLGLAQRIAPHWPRITFYDYTKSEQRARSPRPVNWHVTFSYSGRNGSAARRVLEGGGTVAVVYRLRPAYGKRPAEPLPERWRGWPVLDGDAHDLRWTDPAGHVVGLRLKGRNRARTLKAAGRFAVKA